MSGISSSAPRVSSGCLENPGYNCRVVEHIFISNLALTTDLMNYRLVQILKHKPGPQMSYQVAFCLWLLSFEQNVAERINQCVVSSLLPAIILTD